MMSLALRPSGPFASSMFLNNRDGSWQDVTDWLRSIGTDQFDPTTAAGAFSVLPGDRTEISWERFEAARQTLRRTNMFITGANERVDNTDVWTHLVLRAAAEKEGIAVSDRDLREFLKLRIPPEIWNDRTRYKDMVTNNGPMSAAS